jgi:hypothetical protein
MISKEFGHQLDLSGRCDAIPEFVEFSGIEKGHALTTFPSHTSSRNACLSGQVSDNDAEPTIVQTALSVMSSKGIPVPARHRSKLVWTRALFVSITSGLFDMQHSHCETIA